VKGNAVKDLQLGDFSEIEIICPPLSKQIKFSEIYYKTNQSIKKSKDNYSVSDDLFNSVIQKAFNGELVK
jgi:type I restriction enzyme S subunit